jgi:hypothetical protein
MAELFRLQDDAPPQDEYRLPECIAEALWHGALRMPAGDAMVWVLIDRLAEIVPHATVAELRDALMIYYNRYAAGMDEMACLPTVTAPEAMQ